MATDPLAPLIVIAGPTASGKTALAIKLAQEFNGEVICADSRTIYKDMDIGTAKPSQQEQALVPHWGLDLVEPGETFSAANFKAYATNKIADIRRRGRVPFIVGGTGLYIDAVVYDYKFGPPADRKVRQKLEQMSLERLHEYCEKNNVKLPENKLNKRYVVRAIEQKGISTRRKAEPIDNTVVVAITTDRDTLRTRIEHRAEQLLTNGVVEEAKLLGKKYGWDSEAMTGNIYPLIKKYIDGELSESELQQKFIVSDWRLAKRQLTWLRRSEHITWLSLAEAEHFLAQNLARYTKT